MRDPSPDMKIQFPSLSVIRFRIRWAARSPVTWMAAGFAILMTIASLLAPQYAGYANAVLFVTIVPAAGGLAIGPGFARTYFILYRRINQRLPWNKSKNFCYYLDPRYSESKPGLLEPTVHATLNLFGLLYVIITTIQLAIPSLVNPNSTLLLSVLLTFPCVMISSGFNVAAWVYKSSGFMFKNEKDGDIENFARSLRRNLSKVIGAGAAISFATMLSTSPGGIGTSIAIMLAILTFSFLPTLIGFYLIRRKHLEKIRNNFIMKVNKYIDTERA